MYDLQLMQSVVAIGGGIPLSYPSRPQEGAEYGSEFAEILAAIQSKPELPEFMTGSNGKTAPSKVAKETKDPKTSENGKKTEAKDPSDPSAEGVACAAVSVTGQKEPAQEAAAEPSAEQDMDVNRVPITSIQEFLTELRAIFDAEDALYMPRLSETAETDIANLFDLLAEVEMAEDGTVLLPEGTAESDFLKLLQSVEKTLHELNGSMAKPEESGLLAADMPAEGESDITAALRALFDAGSNVKKAALAERGTSEPATEEPVVPISDETPQTPQVQTVAKSAANEKSGEGFAESDTESDAKPADVSQSFALEPQQKPAIPADVPPVNAEEQAPPVNPTAVIDQIVEKAAMNQQAGVTKMEIDLNPAHLGKLSILLTVAEDGVSATIRAANDSVKNMLAFNIAELQESLKDAGIHMRDIEVESGELSWDFSRGNPGDTGERKPYEAQESITPLFRGMDDGSFETEQVVTQVALTSASLGLYDALGAEGGLRPATVEFRA
ncbi:flagellar hook-length control protein FliK [Oscillospiraceae bacterium OttesenSCG-928-G22]|nr:flagellar hook-length control protein FliK [Oscillospiraceae bacterium OttesenSCG-928-G22]